MCLTDDGQEPPSSESDSAGQDSGNSDSNHPPKSKRPRSQETGETAAPPITVDREKKCLIANPGEDWRFKCYVDFLYTELDLRFVTTRYRREYYHQPRKVASPLPCPNM